jgi:dTDP-4-amino-4,6-dideoxygalactose transaminase
MQFIDLHAQRRRIGESMNQAIQAVVESGQYILGPQVTELEKKLADFAGTKHCVSCANGTDALVIVLRAWGIGPGDAVFVPAFTFAATAEVVTLVGASPVFVDVFEDTYNMDPASLQAAIDLVKKDGALKPRVVIPVDLFGQPADYAAIAPICQREGLKMFCDTAQGFGGLYHGKRAGGIGDAAATSFFPAKPLGCYGDGGASFTNDDEMDELLRSIRVHGQGIDKYENVRIGLNSRLDTIQAAVLLKKLEIFADEIEMREGVAQRYIKALSASGKIVTPRVIAEAQSTWAQFTIQVPNRDKLQADLKASGIPTAVYYPIPLNRQKAYAAYPSAPTPVCDKLSKVVVALPMHPYLEAADQDKIAAAVLASVG